MDEYLFTIETPVGKKHGSLLISSDQHEIIINFFKKQNIFKICSETLERMINYNGSLQTILGPLKCNLSLSFDQNKIKGYLKTRLSRMLFYGEKKEN